MVHPSKIKLLIVDDHPIVRDGLRSLALECSGIHLVDVCGSAHAAMAILRRHAVDVALVDMRMHPINGVELLRQMQRYPNTKGIVLSSYELEEEVFQARTAGAMGYISKDLMPSEILEAILSVYTGKTVFPAYLLDRIAERERRKGLTPSELRVLQFVAKGLSNKEIAQQLGVSQFTVRNQLRSLSTKLEAKDRTQVARIAIEQGIIILERGTSHYH